jgi:membrane protein implicated in regulation of membrane protease activity
VDPWDDDEDLEAWSEGASATGPTRTGLVVVAAIVLVPFVLLVGGGVNAIDALGPGLVVVALFFAAVALAYVLVRRWLRRRVVDRTVWSDRR